MAAGGGKRHGVGSLMLGLKQPPAKVWDRDRDLDTAREDPELRDLRKLATFNWGNEEEEPSIMFVPGEPSILNQWGGGQLVGDNEVMPLLGENFPKFPLEPVFRGVELCSGEPLDPSQFDIITTRNNLRQLFMFCDIDRDGYRRQKPFRMEVERMGNTVFLMFNPATEQKKRTIAQVFGLDYERACLQPLKDALIHGPFKEVLCYRLGDLKLLVYSEADCVIATQPDDDDFVSKMGDLSVGSPETPPIPQPFARDSPIQYIKCGSVPEPYETVELATGRKGALFRMEMFTKMYFSGTDFLYFGRHFHGNFDQPKLISFQEVIDEIGGVPVVSLSRLLSLLHNLVSYIRTLDQQQGCALVWFPFDRDTGQYNNRRLNLFWKEAPGLQGIREEPVVHSLPDSLWYKPPSSFNPQAVGPSKERKKLVLQPRTKPLGSEEVGAVALVFGDAQPVDTTKKDRQVEQKLHKQKQDSAKKWSTELDRGQMAEETENDSSSSGCGAVESSLQGERDGADSRR